MIKISDEMTSRRLRHHPDHVITCIGHIYIPIGIYRDTSWPKLGPARVVTVPGGERREEDPPLFGPLLHDLPSMPLVKASAADKNMYFFIFHKFKSNPNQSQSPKWGMAMISGLEGAKIIDTFAGRTLIQKQSQYGTN